MFDSNPDTVVRPAHWTSAESDNRSSRPGGAIPGRADRRVVLIFAVLLVAWLGSSLVSSRHGLVPRGAGIGADVAMFMAASHLLRDGGNPYDHTALYRTEVRMLHRERVPITSHREIVRVGNPPLFFWLLGPLTRIPFVQAAVLWMIGMYLLSLAGFLAVLRAFRWTRPVLPTALFLLMPQVVLGAAHANNIALVFAGVALALALTNRFPFLAGMFLGSAWLKPQVGLPVVVLLVLFHTTAWRRTLAGFATATVAMVVLIWLTSGISSLLAWIAGMAAYGHDITDQTAIPSVAGAYVLWAPPRVRLVLTLVLLALAVLATLLQYRRTRGAGTSDFLDSAWLWFVWFLATPYTHLTDEILLAIPVVALLGRDGRRIPEWLPAMSVIALVFAPLNITWAPLALVVPIVVLACTAPGGRAISLGRWRVIGPYLCLALSALSHYVALPMNGQFLALMAASMCLIIAARDGSLARAGMVRGGARPDVVPA